MAHRGRVHPTVTALDAYGAALFAAFKARKAERDAGASARPFAFDGLVGVTAAYVHLGVNIPSGYLLTDTLLDAEAVPIEVRFESGVDGSTLLSDMVGDLSDAKEGSLKETVFRQRRILEDQSDSSHGERFHIHLIPTPGLERFAREYRFAPVQLCATSRYPEHSLHLSRGLEDLLGADEPDFWALDPTAIAFWALDHLCSLKYATPDFFSLAFLLRILYAFETESAEQGIKEHWLSPRSWYMSLASLSQRELQALKDGIRRLQKRETLARLTQWEVRMRGGRPEAAQERYKVAFATYATIVRNTATYYEMHGPGQVDLDQARSYPFLLSEPRRPSNTSIKSVERYRARRHAPRVSTVPERFSLEGIQRANPRTSGQSDAFDPHPGKRLSIEPDAAARSRSREAADRYDSELHSAIDPLDLSSAWPDRTSSLAPLSPTSPGPSSPTINFSNPFRKPEDMWPTQEELAMRRVDVGADSPYQAESRKSSAHSARSLKNVARKVFRR